MQSWMIGVTLGMVLIGYAPALPGWPLILCSALLATVPVLRAFPGVMWRVIPVRWWRLVGGLSLGVLLGVAHGLTLLDHRLTPSCVGRPLTVEGQVATLPSYTTVPGIGIRQTFRFRVTRLQPVDCAGPQELILHYYGTRKLVPGDFWRFAVRLKAPWGLSNPGGYNWQVWLAQQGIHATGSVRPSKPQGYLGRGVSGLHHRIRQRISTRIGELDLPPDTIAVLRAVSVADKTGLDETLWSLFQQFGINHLLVISGLHVGLVAGIGYLLGTLLVRVFARGRASSALLPGLCALTLALLFAALAGFSLPAVRAVCMLACVLVAVWTGRLTLACSHLLLAALVVLLLNPLAAVGSGFWLSFGSVAGLLWYLCWRRSRGGPAGLLQAHAYMALLMLPFGALFFQGASLVGVLGNLVMIPLVGWVVVPAALAASASFLLHLPIEMTLWQCAAWPLEHALVLARLFADWAGDGIYVSRDATLASMLLGVCGVCLLVVPATACCRLLCIVLLLPVLLPDRMSEQDHSGTMEVIVFDVGQGTAVLIRSGTRALLYDTGGGQPEGANMATRVILPYLARQGLTGLDTFIISHPDLDHSAGQYSVLRAVAVQRLRYGGAPARPLPGLPCVAGEAWHWPGGQIFQFLSPAMDVPLKRNNASCVLVVQSGRYRLLLPGDIERVQEQALVQYWGKALHTDWLLAGHHGSRTSSSWSWLKFASPHTVVVSNGYANRFGHPHPDVVRRFAMMDTQVVETWRRGAIHIEFTLRGAPASSFWRDSIRRYWL